MKFWTLAFLAVGCTGTTPNVVKNDQDPTVDEDTTPPTITHEPIETSQPNGQDVLISCTATDEENPVFMVRVFYKKETDTLYEDVQLRPVDAAGTYEGEIPGDDVASAGMDYYISAIDGEDNEAFMPDDGPDDPYHFRVSAN